MHFHPIPQHWEFQLPPKGRGDGEEKQGPDTHLKTQEGSYFKANISHSLQLFTSLLGNELRSRHCQASIHPQKLQGEQVRIQECARGMVKGITQETGGAGGELEKKTKLKEGEKPNHSQAGFCEGLSVFAAWNRAW